MLISLYGNVTTCILSQLRNCFNPLEIERKGFYHRKIPTAGIIDGTENSAEMTDNACSDHTTPPGGTIRSGTTVCL